MSFYMEQSAARILSVGGAPTPAVPRNIMLDEAKGTYIFFLDSDDELPGQELFAGKAVVSLNLSNYYGEEARDPDNLNTRGSFILEALHSLDAGSFRNSFEILLEYVEGAIVLCLICDDRIMDQHSARKILAIWLGKMKEQL